MTAINGQAVTGGRDIRGAMRSAQGDKLTVTVQRNGATVTVTTPKANQLGISGRSVGPDAGQGGGGFGGFGGFGGRRGR